MCQFSYSTYVLNIYFHVSGKMYIFKVAHPALHFIYVVDP